MPLTRRSTGRVSASIWPGFVDAMTALLLVMMFLLTIFMVVQFVLREEISGQASRLDALTAEVSGLAELLGVAERRGDALEAERDAQADEIAALTAERAEQADEIASFEAQVASLIAERDEARDAVAAGAAREAELLSEQEALSLALASAREEIDAQVEAARLAAARREALEALTADLRADLEAREETAAALSSEVESLVIALDEEEAARIAEAAAAQALRERLASADAELSALSLALEEERRAAEETLTLLAAADAVEEDLNARLTAALLDRDDLDQRLEAVLEEALAVKLAAEIRVEEHRAEADRQAALLATAREALAEHESEASQNQRRMAALDRQVARLRQQIGTLQSLLTLAEETSEERNVEIERLGAQLNAALAREAEEQRRRADAEASERARLERYQSEFFGRLRDVLGDREGVEISGDRFVFDSEVLFSSGSAVLSAAGRSQIERVAGLLSDIADEIPEGIDWVIRVDGHTDDVPVSGTRYADNWELSQARALSVVRYMSEELGFPAQRLAPTGFGEYRPIAPGTSPEARALNRRIELKLTER